MLNLSLGLRYKFDAFALKEIGKAKRNWSFFPIFALQLSNYAHRNPNMDVSSCAAGWSGSSYGVVFPKQETTLWQGTDNHLVRIANLDGWIGGLAALQPADKAEIQLGGNANNHLGARQFGFGCLVQGFRFLQKRLSDTIRTVQEPTER